MTGPVLISGGAGFIGSHAVSRLCGSYRVHVIDNLSHGDRSRVSPNAVFHLGDIREHSDLRRVFSNEQFETVIHCAALASGKFDASELQSTNVIGTRALVRFAERSGVRRFVLLSSCSVYGESKFAADESTGLRPLSKYGHSKVQAEKIVAASDMCRVILRPSNVYGPGQASDAAGGAIAIFIRRLIEGEIIEVYGDGLQTRDFVFVDDLISAVALGVGCLGNGTWNVASGNRIAILSLLEKLQVLTQTKARVVHKPVRPGDIGNSQLSIRRLQSTGAWFPKVSLDEGLKLVIDDLGSRREC